MKGAHVRRQLARVLVLVASALPGVWQEDVLLAQVTTTPPPILPVMPGQPTGQEPVFSLDSAMHAADTIAFQPDTAIALRDVVRFALRASPVAAGAVAQLRIARSDELVAGGEFLPTLSVTSGALHQGAPSFSGISTAGDVTNTATAQAVPAASPQPATTAQAASPLTPAPPTTSPRIGVSSPGAPGSPGTATGPPYFTGLVEGIASWDLFTAGRRLADVRYSRAETRAARSSRVEQDFLVIDDVKTTFYNVLRSEDLAAVAQVEIARAGEDLRAARHRRDVGTATPADVLQFELNLATAFQTLIQARINQRSYAYDLGRLAGLDESVDAQREGTYDPTPLALPDSGVIALALRQAPMLLASRDSSSAADAAVAAARTQYAPTLTLGGSYTWYSTMAVNASPAPGWAIDIGTSFPIFNGFLREATVERASALSYAARYAAQDAERFTRAQAQSLLGAVKLAAENVTVARGSLAVAQENYRVISTRYGVGVATVLDLSVAEQTLASAEQGLVNARYDYQLARANLQTLLGQEV
jgi:outer membrane protein